MQPSFDLDVPSEGSFLGPRRQIPVQHRAQRRRQVTRPCPHKREPKTLLWCVLGPVHEHGGRKMTHQRLADTKGT
ncbi:MAG: hypothetical protein ACI9MC_002486, partial [Kiritimatiellia bacterium]